MEASLERKPVVDKSGSCPFHKAALYVEQVQTLQKLKKEKQKRKTPHPT